jgi:hypothetical protein
MTGDSRCSDASREGDLFRHSQRNEFMCQVVVNASLITDMSPSTFRAQLLVCRDLVKDTNKVVMI